MPNIEIIALRLNLDKEQDRALFETIRSLVDSGNRNEFLKRSLSECLTEGGLGRIKAAAQDKKQRRGEVATSVGQALPEAVRPAQTIASGITRSVVHPVSNESAGDSRDQEASDKEAAGLVASFVQ